MRVYTYPIFTILDFIILILKQSVNGLVSLRSQLTCSQTAGRERHGGRQRRHDGGTGAIHENLCFRACVGDLL